MRYFTIFSIILFLITACSKDDDLKFPVTEGERLVRYAYFHDSKERQSIDLIYNQHSQVIKTMRKYTTGAGAISFYNNYNDFGKVEKIYSSSSKEKFSYDHENRLSEIYSYTSRNGGITFETREHLGKRFHYDDYGILYRKEIIFDTSFLNSSNWGYTIKDYYFKWDKGNVIAVEEYNLEGILAITRVFEFDNHKNYRNNHPEIFGYDAKGLSQNNVIKEYLLDHLGFYPSMDCKTCEYIFNYNKNGKPVMYHNPKVQNSYTILYYN